MSQPQPRRQNISSEEDLKQRLDNINMVNSEEEEVLDTFNSSLTEKYDEAITWELAAHSILSNKDILNYINTVKKQLNNLAKKKVNTHHGIDKLKRLKELRQVPKTFKFNLTLENKEDDNKYQSDKLNFLLQSMDKLIQDKAKKYSNIKEEINSIINDTLSFIQKIIVETNLPGIRAGDLSARLCNKYRDELTIHVIQQEQNIRIKKLMTDRQTEIREEKKQQAEEQVFQSPEATIKKLVQEEVKKALNNKGQPNLKAQQLNLKKAPDKKKKKNPQEVKQTTQKKKTQKKQKGKGQGKGKPKDSNTSTKKH